jgi:hypothetical protein
VSKEDHKIIGDARAALPGLAKLHHDKPSIRAALQAAYPALTGILGEMLLDSWIWSSLRKLKEKLTEDEPDPQQLPLFGSFGQQILPRENWDEDGYRQYWARYNAMAENSSAKRARLAEEFYNKFGHAITDPPAEAAAAQ